MAEITITLREDLKLWLEQQASREGFPSVEKYARQILNEERDRMEPDRQISLEELREMIQDGEDSGISDKSVEQVFAEAHQLAASRRRALG